ncbi:serine hydrolase domain-containing protein [Actinophytocola sp.]|uniref:serine hydrolase domain-containing protein n=1 Tax=Actinophytocola sp. TaxID=1872138 RepID=UPI00389A7161
MRSLVMGLVLAVVPPAPASIDAYVQAAVESTGLPGVSVVVTHGDRVVRATGAGHDSLGHPVTADTPMRVASVSKSFTAAAVLSLPELSLDAPVSRWLPFPRGVTVRQLLNQTSGIRDSSVDIGRLASTRTLAEYVSLLSGAVPADPPGTSWSYSNVNYDVAARLVEVVSGRPFDEYVRSAVFEPLGMRDSSVGGWAADGYNSLFGLWFSRPELSDGPAVDGSGAVVTTARDMGRWLIAQTGNGSLSPAVLRTMHEPSAVNDYGMGWAPDDNGLLVHSGNLWTYNAIQAIDPKTGYGYAVMTNGAGLTDDTAAILDGLVALTRGETPETPGGSRQLTEGVLAAVALLAAALGALSVARARRWASRTALRRTRGATRRPDTAFPPEPQNPSSQPQTTARISAETAPLYGSETPTLSRGRPALPVYRQGVTGRGMSILPVDNRSGCGQLWRRIWSAVRLGATLLPGLLFALYPQLVSVISAGRTVLWAQLFYFALPLTVTLAVAAVAGLAVFVARMVRVVGLRSVP